jgi:hypothetical protein
MKDKNNNVPKNFRDRMVEGTREYMVKSYEFRMKFAEKKMGKEI